jgi:hypothetical protein
MIIPSRCPKCDWDDVYHEASHGLRWCGPLKRAAVNEEGVYLRYYEDPDPLRCTRNGEHFHWECYQCEYQQVLDIH